MLWGTSSAFIFESIIIYKFGSFCLFVFLLSSYLKLPHWLTVSVARPGTRRGTNCANQMWCGYLMPHLDHSWLQEFVSIGEKPNLVMGYWGGGGDSSSVSICHLCLCACMCIEGVCMSVLCMDCEVYVVTMVGIHFTQLGRIFTIPNHNTCSLRKINK